MTRVFDDEEHESQNFLSRNPEKMAFFNEFFVYFYTKIVLFPPSHSLLALNSSNRSTIYHFRINS